MKRNRLFELQPPIIFAHRGSSAYAPENTLAAFDLAIKQNVTAIELDATLTADQEVVVFHDSNTERITGYKGKINQLNLAEVKKLDAGSFFDASFQGEQIPTLEEVFDLVGDRVVINIELKNYANPFDALPRRVADLIKKWNLHENIFFSSFNPIALWKIKNLLPEVPIALLALDGKQGWLARSRFGEILAYQAIHPYYVDVSPQFLSTHHQKGHLVNVYTVNDPAAMRALFDMGVDGIFTDDPLLAQEQLKTFKQITEKGS
ncbi:MAG: Glycerophosphoryl diester phosphodiesterase [Anaerolineae bacterium]|nr:MAG: Glycerophosphoryl diester phosphodiesterase [Anaerolineae bacterium]